MADQEKKVIRAQRTCSGLSKEMKDKVTNGDIFETDMNLRAEKEKQRAALIKLREISSRDPGSDFHPSLVLEYENLGVWGSAGSVGFVCWDGGMLCHRGFDIKLFEILIFDLTGERR